MRLGSLEKSGYATVLSLLDTTPARLQQLPGIGQQTATQAVAAARQLAAAVREGMKVRVDLDPGNQRSTALITALHDHDSAQTALQTLEPHLPVLDGELATAIKTASPTRGRLRMMLTRAARKDEATRALRRANDLLTWAEAASVASILTTAAGTRGTALAPEEVWADFAHRAADYYGVLGQVVDLGLDVAAAEGFLPAEIVAQVNEQQLDETFRTVALRGYQSFGARFALVERRVIIGDEMGLGKTIQAIAALAHLKALGTHFLVVCPASVLINWMREVTSRSSMRVYRLHGTERDRNLRSWISRGDVAVTTFESLRGLAIPQELVLGMLVIDEAHFAKNPAAQRSQAVNAWTQRVDRVLFLTGTRWKQGRGVPQPRRLPPAAGRRRCSPGRRPRRRRSVPTSRRPRVPAQQPGRHAHRAARPRLRG